ncbi:MAG: sulfatase-like hydrolase/transferase [Pirellulaceae bacterium]|nr:sulfatase-like hydrolase/transferase [Pirellulaceae bacterium]
MNRHRVLTPLSSCSAARWTKWSVGCVSLAILAIPVLAGRPCMAEQTAARPNFLWLTTEDIGPDLGCYGDDYAVTPRIDKLASEGVRYTEALAVAGVCAISRTCLITGMYGTTLGSQDMRSEIRLPDRIRTFSQVLRDSGYYCTNNSKTDYNFASPRGAWDECSKKAHWRNRKPDQPFFAVFNYMGTHESRIWEENHGKNAATLSVEELRDPDRAPVPPFHPDVAEVRRDWANYYDNISTLDGWIGRRLAELDAAGVADDTIVFFYSDHGAGMPLCKKSLSNAGLRVPLVIRFPEKYRHLAPGDPGTTSDRLVSFVDFAPTVLSLAGVDIPGHMQGEVFLGGQESPPRRYAHATRDRMIEWYDTVRVVRDKKYHYQRNFLPHLSYAPFDSYVMKLPSARAMVRLHEEGRLDPIQDRCFHARPAEELYDLEADPRMVANLADRPEHASVLRRMRDELRDWQLRTRDLGLLGDYEMHRRAEGMTQYDVGQSKTLYPLERILPVAEMIGRRDAARVPELVSLLDDDEPAVRWWAAMGLTALGREASEAEPALRRCLADDSPLVRVAAAEGLYLLGRVDVALTTLIETLDDPTPFARLRALNALYRMGDDARPALPTLEKASIKGILPASHYNKMLEYVVDRLKMDWDGRSAPEFFIPGEQ